MNITKRFVILLAPVCAMAFLVASCAKETPVIPIPDPDPVPAPVRDTMPPLQLVSDGTLRYSIVCPEDAPRAARVLASRINGAFRQCADVSERGIVSRSFGEDALEIIVGFGAYPPADSMYRQMTYGQYAFSLCGSKILLAATGEASYTALGDYVCAVLSKCCDRSGSNIVLDGSVFTKGCVSGVSGYVPPFKTDKFPDHIFQCGASSNEDVAMQVDFSDCGIDDFDSYCSSLARAGYDRLCDNAFGTCHYATWSDGKYQVSVSFYGDTGLFKVVSEPAYEKPLWSIEGKPGSVQPLMMQGYKNHPRNNNSSNFGAWVIRLSDGRFLVYDTGVTWVGHELVEYMRSRNTFEDGKIHIAMIIISHPHGDHLGGMDTMINYSDEIVCDAIAFNIVNHTRQSEVSQKTLFGYINRFTKVANAFGARCYCLRAGQVVNLAGARLEVLLTPDELGTTIITSYDGGAANPIYSSSNNTSNIVRLTVDGQKIAFPGDCYAGEAQIFCNLVLNSFSADIMVTAHHCYGYYPVWVPYQKAQPRVLFWSIDSGDLEKSWELGGVHQYAENLLAIPSIKEHFFQDDLVEIELPYWPE